MSKPVVLLAKAIDAPEPVMLGALLGDLLTTVALFGLAWRIRRTF